jgi:uncharacterized protein YaiI (UPF0178 family)
MTSMPTIWVDADATPKPVRDVICKAAIRTVITTYFVANHRVPVAPCPHIHTVQVEAGFDVADNVIVQRAEDGDLVITQDIPLAAELMERAITVINNRGETYTAETIRQRLNMRDFMETLRSSGVQSGGPAAFSDRDKQQFANSLDRWLTRQRRA